MKKLRIISFLLSIGIPSIINAQAYHISKLDQEDGLLYKTGVGFFQDSEGVIWIANGTGFTRIFGDSYDQIKTDRFVFNYGNFSGVKTIGNKYYWRSSFVHNNTIDYISHKIEYQIKTTTDETDQTLIHQTDPFIDKYDFYWGFRANDEGDSLKIIRYKGTDTVDVKRILDLANISIEIEHHVQSGNYYFRLPLTENIKEDDQGNLWFNTNSGGLVKFDFTSREFTEIGSIPNIAEVLSDDSGNYWISSYPTKNNPNPGVFKVNEKGKIQNYKTKKESKIYFGRLSNMYLLDDSGIHTFNGKTFNPILTKPNIYALQFDSKGRIYGKKHVHDTTEIFVFYQGVYTPIMSFYEKYLHSKVQFLVDREDVVWIASPEGVYKCIPSDLEISEDFNSVKTERAWLPVFTSNRGDFFYSRDDGVYIERDGILTKITSELMPPQSEMTEDRNGNVYFLTGTPDPNNSWAYDFPDLLKSVFKVKSDLTVENIIDGSISDVVQKGSFFRSRLRYYDDGLYIISGDGVHFKEDNQPFKFVGIDTSLYQSEFGGLSFCHDVNFYLYTRYLIPSSPEDVDKYGMGEQVTLKFDFENKVFSPFSEVPDSLKWDISQVCKIPEGWIGFAEQMIVVNQDENYSFYEYDKEALGGFWVMPTFNEPLIADDGYVYYRGKGMGVISFNYKTGKFTQKKVKDGLINSDVSSIFFSPDSTSLFVNTPFGLQQIECQSVHENGALSVIKTWDSSTGYNGAGRHQFENDSTLKLWSGDGVEYSIDLSGNYRTNAHPTIYFSELLLNNDTVDWLIEPVDVRISNYGIVPKSLNLIPDQNHLTFFYQGVSHLEYELWYEYRLLGLQDDWIKTENKSVSYPDLNYGDYTFEVKAVNEIGESEIISIPFHIEKHWYQTTLARVVFALLSLGGFLAFFRIRTAALRKRQVILEEKVDKATIEIKKQKQEAEHQRDVVEEKNQEILDSITYAKRLQTAILPPQKLVKEWLNDSFIFYKPKDIVAGDFYWMETTKRNGRSVIFYAAADCTGHGVPGAMVSVVCSNALKRAIKEFDISDPGQLLDKVAEIVQESFEQSEHEVKDGMDIAVCAIDLLDRKVWFSGAHNSLYRITGEDTKVPEELKVLESGNRKLVEYSANKQPVGAYEHMEPFTTIEIDLEPGDCIYLFSDGFADQFGGEKGKKFKYKPFKQLLLDIEDKEMDSQKDILDTEFERWKGNLEQVDDVCIIGLRVNGHMRKLFSKRELDVIKKIKEGRQSKEIADELNIAKSTVDTHRKRILAKTNLNNAAELIKFCDEHEVL